MSHFALIETTSSAPPSVESDEWYTTAETDAWARGRAGVGGWDLDVAACDESHLAAAHFTKAHDGLAQPWRAARVWCNPPYSQIAPWIEKAWLEFRAGRFDVLGMSIPATRTEQAWWQTWIEPHRDARGSVLTSHFRPGRIAFWMPGTGGAPKSGATFGCVLLVWRRA